MSMGSAITVYSISLSGRLVMFSCFHRNQSSSLPESDKQDANWSRKDIALIMAVGRAFSMYMISNISKENITVSKWVTPSQSMNLYAYKPYVPILPLAWVQKFYRCFYTDGHLCSSFYSREWRHPVKNMDKLVMVENWGLELKIRKTERVQCL